MLLDRRDISVYAALEHLVGLQAQVPTNPYFGLWSRLDGFRPDELSQLVADRLAVRAPLMRTTIHLVTARDALAIYPIVRPVLERTLWTTAYGKGVDGVDVEALLAVGREFMEDQPRTRGELGRLLGARWPDLAPDHLALTIHYLLPLVQVPPRGLWRQSGQPTWTTIEAWLGRSLSSDPSPDALVTRYLAAYGPASAADFRTWSGVGIAGEVLQRLRPRLDVFQDERGRELLDLPDAPRPDPDTPAPPRFLPEYDNAFLSHADRARIVSDEHRALLATRNNVGPGPFLVDGFIRGTWRISQNRGRATLVITPVAPLSASAQNALAEEGEHLLSFAAEGEPREVQFKHTER